MKRGTLLILLFLGPECLAEQLPQQDKRPHFTLAVCDQVGLNSEVLALARQQTEEIFRRAEVEVTWVDLDRRSQCTMVPGTPNHFTIAILPHGPHNAVAPDAMGLRQAALACFHAPIFSTTGFA